MLDLTHAPSSKVAFCLIGTTVPGTFNYVEIGAPAFKLLGLNR